MLLRNANLLLDGHAELQGLYDVLVKDDRIAVCNAVILSHATL
jgi:hypothetical protein